MALLRGPVPRRPDPLPLELDDTRVVAAGTLLWLAALVVLAVLDVLGVDVAGAGVPGWWLVMCACGAALGVVGLRYIARRKQAQARNSRARPPARAPARAPARP